MSRVEKTSVTVKVRTTGAVKVKVETEVMRRYRLAKRSVMSVESRNLLLTRNYARLKREVCCSPFARALGRDEAESVIGEVMVLIARVFDPTKYRNPKTRRHFRIDDIGDLELDRLFRNYANKAINTALGRALHKRTRETPLNLHEDLSLLGRECDPAFLAELMESLEDR